jgi:hypothetical protein
MSDEQRHVSPSSVTTQRPFNASIAPNPDGGWLAIVNMGDGASLTKWFQTREGAEGYGDELAAWLEQRREDS